MLAEGHTFSAFGVDVSVPAASLLRQAALYCHVRSSLLGPQQDGSEPAAGALFAPQVASLGRQVYELRECLRAVLAAAVEARGSSSGWRYDPQALMRLGFFYAHRQTSGEASVLPLPNIGKKRKRSERRGGGLLDSPEVISRMGGERAARHMQTTTEEWVRKKTKARSGGLTLGPAGPTFNPWVPATPMYRRARAPPAAPATPTATPV